METEEYIDELDGFDDFDDPVDYLEEFDDDPDFDDLDDAEAMADMFYALSDDDDDDEMAEFVPFIASRLLKGRRSRGRRKPVKRARGKGFYKRPSTRQYVTHSQLRSSLGRVQQDVRRNAAGIKQVNQRVTSNRGLINQQNVISRRHVTQIRNLGSRIDQQSQTSLLMSLLEDNTADYEVKSVTLPSAVQGTGANAAANQARANQFVGMKVELEREQDSFTQMLPLLLASGSSTGQSGGGGLFGGNQMTTMALVLAMNK